jgi:hypothetical protein
MAPIVGEEKTVHDGKYVGEMKNGKREGHGRTTYSWGVRIGHTCAHGEAEHSFPGQSFRFFKTSTWISSILLAHMSYRAHMKASTRMTRGMGMA